jgi:glycyl-tRNA synthetase
MLPTKLPNFNRDEFEDTCKRKFFYGPSFEIYQGVAGLYDYGPILCAIKNNFLQEWRRHFIIEENMCEIECTCLTPEEVFIHSGHVARFNDVMCRDMKTGECFRLDKLLEGVLEGILENAPEDRVIRQLLIDVGSMTIPALTDVVNTYNVKSPQGNELSEPFPFNLMFNNTIGPDGTKKGYLRPELAQGIFMNFKRILDTYNAKSIPFAIASIGQAFRNEIAPRNSLLRVREFTLAEIEHFVDPNNKNHPKFDSVVDVTIYAWDRNLQARGAEPLLRKISDLVLDGIIDNQTLGYFIGRTQMFLQTVGIKYARFRQHRSDEMAHYAQDCWDCECLTSYGWVECVGIADRSAYDLTQHSGGSGKDLCMREILEVPIMVPKLRVWAKKDELKRKFSNWAGRINAKLDKKNYHDLVKKDGGLIVLQIEEKGGLKEFEIGPEFYDVVAEEEKQTFRTYIPNVIEPSFGVGRILYACLEQNYSVRNGEEKRSVLSIRPNIAFRHVGVMALIQNERFDPLIKKICDSLSKRHLTFYTDSSKVTIGKKYARLDEMGIGFCITADFEDDGKVTLRERDTTLQVRVSVDCVAELVEKLCRGDIQFGYALGMYGAYDSKKVLVDLI